MVGSREKRETHSVINGDCWIWRLHRHLLLSKLIAAVNKYKYPPPPHLNIHLLGTRVEDIEW